MLLNVFEGDNLRVEEDPASHHRLVEIKVKNKRIIYHFYRGKAYKLYDRSRMNNEKAVKTIQLFKDLNRDSMPSIVNYNF